MMLLVAKEGIKLNQKSIRNRKELGAIALDPVQYVGTLFLEKITQRTGGFTGER